MHNVLENLEIDELNKIDLDTEYEQSKKNSNFKAIWHWSTGRHRLMEMSVLRNTPMLVRNLLSDLQTTWGKGRLFSRGLEHWLQTNHCFLITQKKFQID